MTKGMLLVLAGPSGAGKGTLGKMLLASDPSFQFSVSATTRGPRNMEAEGIDYFFVTDAAFDEMVAADAFIEYATVHGNRYGTPRQYVYDKLAQGHNVLLDIDVQGARAVIEAMPECVSVFIVPPSYAALELRLRQRQTENEAEVERRLGNAPGEIAQMGVFQYAIVNDIQEAAFERLAAIVQAEKHRTIRCIPQVK